MDKHLQVDSYYLDFSEIVTLGAAGMEHGVISLTTPEQLTYTIFKTKSSDRSVNNTARPAIKTR